MQISWENEEHCHWNLQSTIYGVWRRLWMLLVPEKDRHHLGWSHEKWSISKSQGGQRHPT